MDLSDDGHQQFRGAPLGHRHRCAGQRLRGRWFLRHGRLRPDRIVERHVDRGSNGFELLRPLHPETVLGRCVPVGPPRRDPGQQPGERIGLGGQHQDRSIGRRDHRWNVRQHAVAGHRLRSRFGRRRRHRERWTERRKWRLRRQVRVHRHLPMGLRNDKQPQRPPGSHVCCPGDGARHGCHGDRCAGPLRSLLRTDRFRQRLGTGDEDTDRIRRCIHPEVDDNWSVPGCDDLRRCIRDAHGRRTGRCQCGTRWRHRRHGRLHVRRGRFRSGCRYDVGHQRRNNVEHLRCEVRLVACVPVGRPPQADLRFRLPRGEGGNGGSRFVRQRVRERYLPRHRRSRSGLGDRPEGVRDLGQLRPRRIRHAPVRNGHTRMGPGARQFEQAGSHLTRRS